MSILSGLKKVVVLTRQSLGRVQQYNKKKMCMYKKKVKFMYTNTELKIVCKSKIVSLQLFLKNIFNNMPNSSSQNNVQLTALQNWLDNSFRLWTPYLFSTLFHRICSSHWPVVWWRGFDRKRVDNQRIPATLGLQHSSWPGPPCAHSSSLASPVTCSAHVL